MEYSSEVLNTFDNRHKRTPLDIGGRSRDKWSSSEHTRDTGYLYSSDSGASFKNASQKAFTGNPNEYTIGGVLSGTKDVEHYFTQVLSVSAIKKIIFPDLD